MKTFILCSFLCVSSLVYGQVETDVDGLSGASYEMPPSIPQDPSQVKNRVKAFFESNWLLSLSTVDPDGSPHAANSVYAYQNGILYTVSKSKAARVRNIMLNPSIAGTIVGPYESFDEIKAVQFKGEARIVSGQDREKVSSLFAGGTFPETYTVIAIVPNIVRWVDRSNNASRSAVIQFRDE